MYSNNTTARCSYSSYQIHYGLSSINRREDPGTCSVWYASTGKEHSLSLFKTFEMSISILLAPKPNALETCAKICIPPDPHPLTFATIRIFSKQPCSKIFDL